MIKNKNENKTADLYTLYIQLKADLHGADTVAYHPHNYITLTNGIHRIEWEWKKGGKLRRWYDTKPTTCSERVYSFKFQGVFGNYIAFELVGKEGPLHGMVQTV